MKNVVLENEILKCTYENKRNVKLEIYLKAWWAIPKSHDEGSTGVKGNQFIQTSKTFNMPLQGQYFAQSYLNPSITDKHIKEMHFYIAGYSKSEWKGSTNPHFSLSYN